MFSEKLREIRKRKELSQQQLADIIGTHRETIARLELSMWNPSYTILKGLVEKAKVDPHELF